MTFRNFCKIFPIGILILSCSSGDDDVVPDLDFRQEMRNFVQQISAYAKNKKAGFLIIPQNGQEILTVNSEADGALATDYISAIDAVGREDLFYGYNNDDEATPTEDREFLIDFCDIAKNNGKVVLTTDYCSTHAKMDDSYSQNDSKGYISFAADHRELDNIPDYPVTIHDASDTDVAVIADVKNFLYLINSSAFATKQAFLDAVKATNYDLVLIDLFFNEEPFTSGEISSLKSKAGGGTRLVICYMSIGESEDYRYYWSSLDKSLNYKENPDWPGNFAVKYWENSWQQIIYGNDQSYTKKIIDAGFDGVYLDIIEGYENFE